MFVEEIFKVFNDNREAEALAKYNDLEQKQNDDRTEASKMPQHVLIEVIHSFIINFFVSLVKLVLLIVEYKYVTNEHAHVHSKAKREFKINLNSVFRTSDTTTT